ncbi:cobalt-precorrin-6A reductase [Octadecabacter sp. 1_MG-2023]|uniref:cobalt-precorrin-6A reductase n=1 Tax=unclassified Octadecabacter TaxID=196158 RepID=UPI001C09F349|nr:MULTISPECIES: cobalt-precorrin-6A reductase [unclassified Octadecabacter]MBU2993401.1 cobalt-precorrin-6A reductase [Octadecabacter sp. B2R22]MDO6733143.1 cobalt-precorrin-6A reductase [Octadecabacter sp. 1_MG-2023]
MTVLLLAGTGEAKRIAWGLADKGRRVVASLAGATRSPDPLPVPTRIGGFGGEDAFREYLAAEGISAVLDATHPFADQITDRTARVCAALEIPYCQVLRPEWSAQDDDNWTAIAAPRDVADLVPKGAVVFLGTGRQTLPEFANLEGRRVLARMIDPPTTPFPFEGGEFVIGRPPFDLKSEMRLFKALGVTHLVVKNSGGTGGRPKLDAAREMGLPVFLLDRPKAPELSETATRVETVQGALAWVAAL